MQTTTENPWDDSTPVINNLSPSFKVCIKKTSTFDPLRAHLQQLNVNQHNSKSQDDKMFGEAWSEEPDMIIENIQLALEDNQLEPLLFQASSTLNGKNSRKVLVHWVSAEDTLPGIALKYDIQIEYLRRFNRLWPSDTRPHRPYLFIPLSLTPKMRHYSREYPDFFYEVEVRSVESVPTPNGTVYKSAIPPALDSKGQSNYFSDTSSCSSLGSFSSEHNNKEESLRPILIIPNGQLKYFPSNINSQNLPQGQRNNKYDINSHHLSHSHSLTSLKALAPLFESNGRPDELETQLLTQNGLTRSKSFRSYRPAVGKPGGLESSLLYMVDCPDEKTHSDQMYCQSESEFEMTTMSKI